MQRTIIAVESDTHGGNKLGLMHPEVVLEDIQKNGQVRKWVPNMTESQRELWILREENIEKLKALSY